ncbi:MAG: hypothetical protein RLZZ444_4550 [Pseudomonadota bacterium]|jgi:molybdopterin molybdotransferase
MMALLPVAEAQQLLFAATKLIDHIETVAIAEAGGRVLAAPLMARLTQPPFDASAMDGYAVRAEDVADLGSRLRVIGQSSAGHGYSGTVGTGEAVRIFTGAPVPEGATVVLLQEDAEKTDDGHIVNRFSPAAGRHIRPRGQDFRDSETVLEPGTVLDAGALMVAAAMNHAELPVYRKPLVAVIATGDELVRPGEMPGPDQIIASSTYAVSHLVRQAGGDVLDLGLVADNADHIQAAVNRAVDAGADIIVTLGGASVGDHDLVQSSLKDMGMVLDFWRIAMRPGKPLMVGALGAVRVLGLPGNPVSTMVCSYLFLEPLLAILGHRPLPNRMAMARTDIALAANDHRQDYLRATLSTGSDQIRMVRPHSQQDSSQMKIFARSDCLIVRPPHAPAAAAGDEVPVLLLRQPTF